MNGRSFKLGIPQFETSKITLVGARIRLLCIKVLRKAVGKTFCSCKKTTYFCSRSILECVKLLGTGGFPLMKHLGRQGEALMKFWAERVTSVFASSVCIHYRYLCLPPFLFQHACDSSISMSLFRCPHMFWGCKEFEDSSRQGSDTRK